MPSPLSPFLPLLLFLLLLSPPPIHSQASWTGNMHPSTGFPPNCNLQITNQCAPSYETLEQKGQLWSCPEGTQPSDPSATCPYLQQNKCEPGTGPNPLCYDLSPNNPCCCAKEGCFVQPTFNTVIGVCNGTSCGCGSTNTEAPSCSPQGAPTQCFSYNGVSCTGPNVPCCFNQDVTPLVPYYNEGTHAKINYWAALEFNRTGNVWEVVPESSLNTDGRFPTYDMMKPYGGLDPSQAWMAPQPGGSVFWSLGYYLGGVKGVGMDQKGKSVPIMFVLSTEDWWGGTWYMLNQLTLDRGPGVPIPADKCAITNDNCWAAGNAGEMDFLETGWNNPSTADYQYRQSFSTQNNQVGRCFNGGINTGGFGSDNWLLTEDYTSPEPIVYVAVVDSVGNWVYRIPASQVSSIWPGINRKTISQQVNNAPTKTVESVNPCKEGFCMTFTSNCQADNYSDAQKQGCMFNGQQGFCGNWFLGMGESGQPLFPGENCVKDVRGGEEMPWCECMVGKGNC